MVTASWLLRLKPDRSVPILPASSAGLLEHAVAAVGRPPVEWAIEHGHAMAVTIVNEMPQFGGSPEAFDVLRMGTEATTIQSLVRLATGSTERPATPEALEGVVDFVRRGIGLDAVLRGVRLGHAEMARGFLEGCERLAPPDDRLSEAKRISDELFDYIDAFSGSMSEHYVQEQVRWSTSELAARRDLVMSLLKDTHADADRISRRLGFTLGAWHIAFVLWTDTTGADADTAELQRAVGSLLQHLPVRQHLVLPVSAGTVWAWASGDAVLTERLRAATPDFPPHLHLSVGRAGRGVAGFRRSHLHAVAAATLAQSTRSVGSTTFYDDVELLSLLLHDRERATEFAVRSLGPLWTEAAQHAHLRTTLRVYLEEQGSTLAASRKLHVARNTVTYRVQRAEAAMQRTVEGRTQEVHAALVIARALLGE